MKRIGIGFIILGIMMTMGALGLLLRNRTEEEKAARSAEDLAVQVAAAAGTSPEEILEEPETDREMPTVRIGGNDYIGYLSIPALELELPVMDSWSYERLKTSPCRYSGSLYQGDLVVMAHNYRGHFGRLDSLRAGDAVAFTDMEGRTAAFQVELVEVLEPGAVEEMTAGEWALTLFTCTYGGRSRVTVRCSAR